jgi:hypothetical protein
MAEVDFMQPSAEADMNAFMAPSDQNQGFESSGPAFNQESADF